jgi:hypothetical protein
VCPYLSAREQSELSELSELSPPMCRHANSLPIGDALRPCHLAWGGLRPVSGGVVFSKLSKLLNQEDALSAPVYSTFAR